MRAADRATPTVDATHPIPPGRPCRPVIAIEPKPGGAWVWDDPVLFWDDPAGYVWDAAPVSGPWVDAFCDWSGVTIDLGNPDEHALFDAPHAVIQLDNRSGKWSQYNVDGSLQNFGPGRHVAIWAVDAANVKYWLFYGRVARWDERGDDTIEVEAFGLFSDLAQPVGTYTPGAGGDRPGARLGAIMTAAQFTDRTLFDAGIVTLTAQATDKAPLEEAQIVAGSDGAILFEDSDGTITSTSRNWRGGRSDQTVFPVVSDNVCTAPIVAWDLVMSTTDAALADRVVLENIAGLKATAQTVTPPAGRYVWTDTDQQWTTQPEGDTLAQFRLTQQRGARVRLDDFALYLYDPKQPSLWRAVDWRIGDRLRFWHDAKVIGGVARLDVIVVVDSISHEITPDGWVMTVGTTRAVDYVAAELWDTTARRWDDPAAVWSF